MARYQLAPVGVIDKGDSGKESTLLLPNADGWRAYQAWIAAGHAPDPLPLPPEPAGWATTKAKVAAREALANSLRNDPALVALRARTLADIDIAVADVATLRARLNLLSRAVLLLLQERFQDE